MLAQKIRDRASLQPLRVVEEEEEEEEDEIKNFTVEDKKITKGQEHYYRSRFGIENTKKDEKFRDIVEKYIEGLEFYARYYFIGLPSWSWYYPYHYTPLLTDVYDYLSENKVNANLEKS